MLDVFVETEIVGGTVNFYMYVGNLYIYIDRTSRVSESDP